MLTTLTNSSKEEWRRGVGELKRKATEVYMFVHCIYRKYETSSGHELTWTCSGQLSFQKKKKTGGTITTPFPSLKFVRNNNSNNIQSKKEKSKSFAFIRHFSKMFFFSFLYVVAFLFLVFPSVIPIGIWWVKTTQELSEIKKRKREATRWW